jgi:hypothetical protein
MISSEKMLILHYHLIYSAWAYRQETWRMSRQWKITLLTAWDRVLEKLIVAQVVKNFPVFYVTRRFITVFIRTCHWTLS